MALFDSIKKQLTALGSERTRMLNKLEKSRQRREDLQTLPLPLDEHITKLCSIVDTQAEQFAVDFRRRMRGHDNHPLQNMNPLSLFVSDHAEKISGQNAQRLLCGLFPNEVKEGIRMQVLSWDWLNAGPPLQKRKTELAELDKTIANLENELRAFDSSAEQSGIEIGQARNDDIRHQGLQKK